MAPEHKGQRKSTSCRVVRIFVVVCGETVIVILKKQTLPKLFTLGNTVKTSMWEPSGFNTQKYKNLFSQTRSSSFLDVLMYVGTVELW